MVLRWVVLALLALVMAPEAGRAAIVRSTNGAPVLSGNGNCVLSAWTGAEDCDEAKADAGLTPTTDKAAGVGETENTVLFGFNQAVLAPHAKHQLNNMARRIHHRASGEIVIVGYADRIGAVAANEKLAMKRAQAVRDYLVGRGVKARRLEVRSLGATQARTHCPDNLPRVQMIDCLKPDRRVEVEIGR